MATTPIYAFTLPTVAGDSGIWGGELNTDITSIENEIARSRVPFVSPTYNVGGTTTLDLNQSTGGRVFVFTVSGASTLAFSNVPSSSFAVFVSLVITNGSAFVLTFPGAVTWLSGVQPTFKAAGTDIVDLETKDGGVTWFASLRNPRPLALYQNQGLSTVSTTDASLASFSLPAGTLLVNGQAIRVTVMGLAQTQGATLNIKFGGTAVGSHSITSGNSFQVVILITRTGATAQLASSAKAELGAVDNVFRSGPAETLANAITVDFRGSVTSGGTLFYDFVMVEVLAVA